MDAVVSASCLGKDVPVQSGYRLPPTKCAAVAAAATVGTDALSSGNDSYNSSSSSSSSSAAALQGGWTAPRGKIVAASHKAGASFEPHTSGLWFTGKPSGQSITLAIDAAIQFSSVRRHMAVMPHGIVLDFMHSYEHVGTFKVTVTVNSSSTDEGGAGAGGAGGRGGSGGQWKTLTKTATLDAHWDKEVSVNRPKCAVSLDALPTTGTITITIAAPMVAEGAVDGQSNIVITRVTVQSLTPDQVESNSTDTEYHCLV